MANTLTGVIPVLYEALNIVSREMVGFIPAVNRDSNADRAAIGQTVRSPIGVAGDLEDVTPGQQPANTGSTTVGYTDMTITSSKAAPIVWTGEESLGIGHTGVGQNVLRDQFADGMRKLVNAIELDIWRAAYKASSRAVGTAGTAPFGTAGDLSDFASVARLLDENGAPVSDRQLVLGHAAIGNLRGKQSVLFKVNEAGREDMLRYGMTDLIQNFAIRHSHPISVHTKGTGASYVTDGAKAIGDKTIKVKTGTGTILAGDVVSFAADAANKYVVATGLTAPGNLVLNKNGLLAPIADLNALSVGNNYTPNIAFSRGAIALATRAPASPAGGDMADDRTFVTDPVSGLVFEVALYRQYRQVKYEISIAWGVGTPNAAHIATLMG